MRKAVWILALTLGACGGGETSSDAGPDAGRDGGPIAGDDAAMDAGIDADAGSDAGAPTIDAGPIPDGGYVHTFPERDFVCKAGATPPCPTVEPLRSAEERTVVIRPDLDDATLAYIVNELRIPAASGGYAPGFNLDGLDSGEGSTAGSATCVEHNRDYVSSLDPGHVGVDNVFALLVPVVEAVLDPSQCDGPTEGCIDRLIADAVASGELLLAVEIRGVDSVENDDDVTVGLYLVEVPGGGAPLIDPGTERIAPGQTFDVVMPVGVPVRGDIFQGRVRVQLGTIMLPMSTTNVPLPAMISNAELRADVSLTALANGALGGSTPFSWIVAEAERLSGMGELAMTIFAPYADIQPTSDPTVCADVSSALALSGVPAILER